MFCPSGPCLCDAPASHLSGCVARRLPGRWWTPMPSGQQKTDADEHAEVFDHIGLLANDRPPPRAVLHFVIRRIRVRPRATPAHPLPAHSSDAHGNTRPSESKRDCAFRAGLPANRASSRWRGIQWGGLAPSFQAVFRTREQKKPGRGKRRLLGTAPPSRRKRQRFLAVRSGRDRSAMRGLRALVPSPTRHRVPPSLVRNRIPDSEWPSGRGGCSRSAGSGCPPGSVPLPTSFAPATRRTR